MVQRLKRPNGQENIDAYSKFSADHNDQRQY